MEEENAVDTATAKSRKLRNQSLILFSTAVFLNPLVVMCWGDMLFHNWQEFTFVFYSIACGTLVLLTLAQAVRSVASLRRQDGVRTRKLGSQSLLLLLFAIFAWHVMTVYAMPDWGIYSCQVLGEFGTGCLFVALSITGVILVLWSLVNVARVFIAMRKSLILGTLWCFPVVLLNVILVWFAVPLMCFLVGMMWDPPDFRHYYCPGNLQQQWTICWAYSLGQQGLYPPLSPEPGKLFYQLGDPCGEGAVSPDLRHNMTVMVCPQDDDFAALSVKKAGWDAVHLVDDWSYFYLGYVVMSDTEMTTFSEVYLGRMARGEPMCEDLKVEEGQGNFGTDTIYRLRSDVPRQHAAESDAAPLYGKPPLFIERRGNHPENAVNVLWFNGKVTLVASGTWPNTDATMAALSAMDALGAK